MFSVCFSYGYTPLLGFKCVFKFSCIHAGLHFIILIIISYKHTDIFVYSKDAAATSQYNVYYGLVSDSVHECIYYKTRYYMPRFLCIKDKKRMEGFSLKFNLNSIQS